MRPDKQTIIETIGATGLVPLFYHGDAEIARRVVEAAYLGGARVFEFAHRGANAMEVFKSLVKFTESWEGFHLGIGTVMNATTARQYVDAGAAFLVSPIFKSEIAEVGNANNLLWIPGCATLTEIVTASEAGASVIKIFPGSVLGPGFVSAVLPVVPGLKLMPTGGVEPTEANLAAWHKAGVFCVGMGSHLFSAEDIQTQQWKNIESKVKAILTILKSLR